MDFFYHLQDIAPRLFVLLARIRCNAWKMSVSYDIRGCSILPSHTTLPSFIMSAKCAMTAIRSMPDNIAQLLKGWLSSGGEAGRTYRNYRVRARSARTVPVR
jgi:hypothetical protein